MSSVNTSSKTIIKTKISSIKNIDKKRTGISLVMVLLSVLVFYLSYSSITGYEKIHGTVSSANCSPYATVRKGVTRTSYKCTVQVNYTVSGTQMTKTFYYQAEHPVATGSTITLHHNISTGEVTMSRVTVLAYIGIILGVALGFGGLYVASQFKFK